MAEDRTEDPQTIILQGVVEASVLQKNRLLEEENRRLLEENARLTKRIDQLMTVEIADLQRNNGALETKIISLEEENKKLREENRMLQSRVTELEQSVAEQKEQIAEQKREVSKLSDWIQRQDRIQKEQAMSFLLDQITQKFCAVFGVESLSDIDERDLGDWFPNFKAYATKNKKKRTIIAHPCCPLLNECKREECSHDPIDFQESIEQNAGYAGGFKKGHVKAFQEAITVIDKNRGGEEFSLET